MAQARGSVGYLSLDGRVVEVAQIVDMPGGLPWTTTSGSGSSST